MTEINANTIEYFIHWKSSTLFSKANTIWNAHTTWTLFSKVKTIFESKQRILTRHESQLHYQAYEGKLGNPRSFPASFSEPAALHHHGWTTRHPRKVGTELQSQGAVVCVECGLAKLANRIKRMTFGINSDSPNGIRDWGGKLCEILRKA